MGQINDNGPEGREEELTTALRGIAARTRRFLRHRPNLEPDMSAEEALEWLENFDASQIDMDDVNAALGDLWDFFDYERALVG